MPKLKASEKEERSRIVRAVIAGNQERYGVDDEALAKRIGVVSRTIRNRKNDPEGFTLRELQEASRVLKFTPIQAASVVLGRDLTSREVRDFIMM